MNDLASDRKETVFAQFVKRIEPGKMKLSKPKEQYRKDT